ncbi:MAG: ATP-binding cassette domain-containing protein [Deltaproteobacteria bacterium]|nr:ATP-binding cassette domain-containing protein [Deltaproteobacteria bacterium]
MDEAIAVRGLEFAYPAPPGGPASPPVFRGFDWTVPAGCRCLLLGANGVGKTTLLRLVGGKHLVPPDAVRVLGRPAFHDTGLVRRVAFLGSRFPLEADVAVREILDRRCPRDAPPERSGRRDALLEALQVEPGWHLHRLSSGQRRRVQLLLGLLDPAEVVLLDEVTADLDVLSRSDLLAFLRDDSERRGTTVIYATHVLDGLTRWATHLCFLSPGAAEEGTRVRAMASLAEVTELAALVRDGSPAPLLELCERWLREERAVR